MSGENFEEYEDIYYPCSNCGIKLCVGDKHFICKKMVQYNIKISEREKKMKRLVSPTV